MRLRTNLEGLRHRALHRGVSHTFEKLSRIWHRAISRGYPAPDPRMFAVLQERVRALIERDLDNVEKGYYPRELLRTFGPLELLRMFPRVMPELPGIFLRKTQGKFNALPANEELDRYPKYYRRNFHWQTDGWLSARSARVYRFEVEFLFFGCADLMRRQLIPPLVDGLQGVARPRIADLACGAGEFLCQLRAAIPKAKLYGVDLSPHYLNEARQRLGEDAAEVTWMAENAEELPLATGSFDAVTSIFLFHELPADARRNVATEALRILKPGGRFVVCDSLQHSDAAGREIGYYLDWFPATYHEPYYKGYVREPMEQALEACGFEIIRSQDNFLSKIVTARKRLQQN